MVRRIVALLLALFVAALFIYAFVQSRFDPNGIDRNWTGTPIPPCFISATGCYGHVLGTDELGRDVLTRIAYGGVVSLGVSLIAVVFALGLGIGAGTLARVGGAPLRYIVESVASALACFPSWAFLVVLIAVNARGPGFEGPLIPAALAALVFAPAIFRITTDGGSLRGKTRALANQAARDWSQIIVLLATVDAVGIGLTPPVASWGAMLSLLNEPEITSGAWWIGVFPALALIAALLVIETERRLLFARSPGSEPDLALASAA